MNNNQKIHAFVIIVLFFSGLFHGCITSKSEKKEGLVTTADLDSRENSKKIEKLEQTVSELNQTISAYQSDARYLREEIDRLKGKEEESEAPEKIREYETGEVIESPPPSIEKIQARQQETGTISESSTKKNGVEMAALNAEDYYQSAYDDLRFGEYTSAIENFRKFVELYPKNSLADNAQYWIGESYYGLKDFKQAADEFEKVYENYPQGNKVPDAKLKHALCLYDLKEIDRCFAELEKVAAEYSGTRVGEVALKQIQRLKKKQGK